MKCHEVNLPDPTCLPFSAYLGDTSGRLLADPCSADVWGVWVQPSESGSQLLPCAGGLLLMLCMWLSQRRWWHLLVWATG